MRVYNDIYASFLSNDFWQSYGPWALKFGQIFSCHQFFFTILGDIDLVFPVKQIIQPELISKWICNL
jgi:hypothetical protein